MIHVAPARQSLRLNHRPSGNNSDCGEASCKTAAIRPRNRHRPTTDTEEEPMNTATPHDDGLGHANNVVGSDARPDSSTAAS